MLLSCPNCGTVTEVADVLIPSARLTATCAGCGGRIGGTVPARLNGGAVGPRPEGGGKRRRRGATDGEKGAPAERKSRQAAGSEKEAPAERKSRQAAGSESAGSAKRRSGQAATGGGDKGGASRPAGARRSEKAGSSAGTPGAHEPGSRPGGAKDAPAPDERRARPAAQRTSPEREYLRAVARGLDPERLAKLVASDLLLYNREKIQRSAAEGCLLSSMATEIAEAWDFYRKRVGAHTALGTPYFRDALNAIAGSEPPFI